MKETTDLGSVLNHEAHTQARAVLSRATEATTGRIGAETDSLRAPGHLDQLTPRETRIPLLQQSSGTAATNRRPDPGRLPESGRGVRRTSISAVATGLVKRLHSAARCAWELGSVCQLARPTERATPGIPGQRAVRLDLLQQLTRPTSVSRRVREARALERRWKSRSTGSAPLRPVHVDALTINEAAIVCGVSRDTIIRRMRAGAFPRRRRDSSGRLDGRWLIPLADLRAAGLRVDAARLATIAGASAGDVDVAAQPETPLQHSPDSAAGTLEAALKVEQAKTTLLEAHNEQLWHLTQTLGALLAFATLVATDPCKEGEK